MDLINFLVAFVGALIVFVGVSVLSAVVIGQMDSPIGAALCFVIGAFAAVHSFAATLRRVANERKRE